MLFRSKIFFGEFYFIKESNYRHHYQALWSSRRPRKLPKTSIMEPVVIIPHRSGNYYHFLIEELPDIIQEIEMLPENGKILASNLLPQFAKKLLEKFWKIEYTSASYVFCKLLIKTPKLWNPLNPNYTSRFDRVKYYLQTLKNKEIPSQNKIFILRDSGDLIENEIANSYARNGFFVTTLSEIDIFEQINLFRNVKQVAGFAGAGFTNCLFISKPRNSKLIEISTQKIIKVWAKSSASPCWEPFAHQLGLKYEFRIH